MNPFSPLRAALTVLLALAACSICRGDGLIIIDDPPQPTPGHFSFAPLEVVYHRVHVKIDDQVAVTTVDQEFLNPNNRQLEGTYMFPLPVGAHIDKFSMDINGKPVEAELLPADKARSIYEEIVRKHRDPALLEYVGRDAMKVRIFPIEANGKKIIRLRYTQLLNRDSGLTEYSYPLSTEKFSSRPLKEVEINVDVKCARPLKSIYSPSHEVEVKHHDSTSAAVKFSQRDVRPDTDFKLIFASDEDPVGIHLMSYRRGSEDGYFMLLASPGFDNAASATQNKDICFVLDTSGSMAGAKLDQAKKALQFCLANLNEGDRFEIIRFSTEAENLFSGLRPADQEHLDRAGTFVKDLKPVGGTAISEALAKALKLKPEGSRPYVVIFLTDGQPTVGERNEDRLVSAVTNANSGNTRIFSFGIGTDINTHLLDRIANDTRAFSQYVLPEEDIELKVSSFYTKIQSPVLSDVELVVGNREDRADKPSVAQVYPPNLPDLFAGQTLVAFGRYSGSGKTSVVLSGILNGKLPHFEVEVDFPREQTQNPFIPRLWATRRVGWLLDEIRLHGESEEVKDEVVRLAREHGIVTPYTAYLILEDEAARNVPLTMRSFSELEADGSTLGRTRGVYESAELGDRLEKAGAQAVENSVAVNSMKFGQIEQQAQSGMALDKAMPTQVAASGAPATQPSGYKVRTNYAQQVRLVNGKTFYQNGATWNDSQTQSKQNLKRQEIKFNSDDYFALLRKSPEVAQWLSLGEEVDLVIDDTLYVVR